MRAFCKWFPVVMAGAMYSELNAAMAVEARMEAMQLNEHQKRLVEFGLSSKEPEPVQGEEWSSREHEGPPGLAAPPVEEGRIHHMLRLMSFSFLLKAGAIMSSVLLTLSPMRAVLNMKEAKSTLSYPPFTFFCVAACGLQWCAYGSFAFLVTNNYGFLILVYSNILGVIMGTYYCWTYYKCITDEVRMRQFMGCIYAAALNYTFEGIVIPTLPHPRALLIVGTLSAFYSVLVSFAPIADLPKIIAKGDISGMPQDVVFASFVASVLWFGCALLLHDTWILVPNFFGLILGGFQLFLLAYFGGIGATPQKGVAYLPVPKKNYGTMEESLLIPQAKEDPEPVVPDSPHFAGTGGTGDGF
jgi:hypothetical protein